MPLPRPLFEVFRYLLGDRGAERLAASGENLSVDRAAAIGLVDEIVLPDELLDDAVERAYVLGERPRAAHAEIKRRSPRRRARAVSTRHAPTTRFSTSGSNPRRGRASPVSSRSFAAVKALTIPADDILEDLDLSRAEPGSGYLERLFLRFNDRVPFETASKILRASRAPDRASRPRTPGVFWADQLASGTGGTCFARVAAFAALLRGARIPLPARARPRAGGLRPRGALRRNARRQP